MLWGHCDACYTLPLLIFWLWSPLSQFSFAGLTFYIPVFSKVSSFLSCLLAAWSERSNNKAYYGIAGLSLVSIVTNSAVLLIVSIFFHIFVSSSMILFSILMFILGLATGMVSCGGLVTKVCRSCDWITSIYAIFHWNCMLLVLHCNSWIIILYCIFYVDEAGDRAPMKIKAAEHELHTKPDTQSHSHTHNLYKYRGEQGF